MIPSQVQCYTSQILLLPPVGESISDLGCDWASLQCQGIFALDIGCSACPCTHSMLLQGQAHHWAQWDVLNKLLSSCDTPLLLAILLDAK